MVFLLCNVLCKEMSVGTGSDIIGMSARSSSVRWTLMEQTPGQEALVEEVEAFKKMSLPVSGQHPDD